MADDSNTQNQAKRFAVLVPSPKTRLNLGDPDATKLSGKFGYSGLSMQTAGNLFIDIAKDSMFQGLKGFNGQVGGTWAQYSTSDMWLSSAGSQHLGGSAKVTIVAGAGQTSWNALDHGTNPSLVTYSNLELHYRLEEIQHGLFEFFHGRRERVALPPLAIKAVKPSGKAVFHRTKSTGGKAFDPGLKEDATESLAVLFPPDPAPPPVAPPDPNAPPPKPPTSSAALLLEDLESSKVMGKSDAKALEFGFSSPFSGLDPYAMKDPAKGKNVVDKASIRMKNAVTYLKRLGDVVAKYGTLVTDNAIVKLALKTTGTLDNLLTAFDTILTFPQAIAGPIVLSFPDEAKSAFGNVGDEFQAHNVGQDIQAQYDSTQAKATNVRQAFVTTQSGPFDLSVFSGSVNLSLSWDASPSASSATLTFPTSGSLAFIPTAIGLHQWQSFTLTITVDATTNATVNVTQANFASLPVFVAAIMAAVGSAATVTSDPSGASNTVTITSASKGTASTVRASLSNFVGISADDADGNTNVSTAVTVDGIAGNVKDQTKVTAAEIQTAFGTLPSTVSSTIVNGALQFTSAKQGAGSSASLTAPKAILTSGWQKYYDWAADSTTVNDAVTDMLAIDKTLEADQERSARAAASQLKTWWGGLEALPSQVKNFARPLMQEVAAASKLVSDCQKVVSNFNPEDWATMFDAKGAQLGLVASGGISLGTPDKLIGSGGKGIVFIADGGTGEPDHKKFVIGEELVKRMMEWNPGESMKKLLSTPDPVKAGALRPLSLGFRVLSDSVADVTSRMAVQMMALGRAEDATNKADGIGIARVGSSYATELLGYRKLVISARHDDTGDDLDKQGRVELAGQVISIGGVKASSSSLNDFAADEKSFGIRAPKLKAAQLFGGFKWDGAKGKYESDDPSDLFKPHVWSDKLQKGHPETKHVHVHAAKNAVIVVGDYLVSVSADNGVSIGTRKAEADALKNEIDDTKPQFTLSDSKAMLQGKKDGPVVSVDGDQLEIVASKDGGRITLKGNKIALTSPQSGDVEVKITATQIRLQQSAGNYAAFTADGIKVKGNMIKWG